MGIVNRRILIANCLILLFRTYLFFVPSEQRSRHSAAFMKKLGNSSYGLKILAMSAVHAFHAVVSWFGILLMTRLALRIVAFIGSHL